MVVLSSSNTRNRLYGTEKWVLHPVVAHIRDQKKRVKIPPKLLFWGRKNEFFSGDGARH